MEELGGRMVILADEKVPRGITGILATRLQKTMDAAAVVISVKGDTASGSIRCDSGMNALAWLEAMSPVLEDFGGHPQAGGFRIHSGNLKELTGRTVRWLEKTSHAPAEPDILSVDAELSHEEITRLGQKGLEHLLESLEPYGEGFKPLTFLTRSVKVFQADLVGKPKNNHLKLLVSLGSHRWPALWWDGAERYGTIIRKNAEVDLVYRVDRDHWRGPDARRLTVLEATPCG
jgi:single-stranded-DNA-specific exonuclease